ncbi:hypothetical protein JG479_16610 [Pseudoalteromonas sp. LC2018020214]|uniref:hypothetical protein n=1 Tax=Pseudoalteromonas sp. LC2018020214 TaxID=2799564 RepID=UPI001908E2B8|nr:hypothetical protein [Pseudoalteromonas sp. LC2018020214]QQM66215.1 hypothetical protein JG479_16610 [Pseudoalteromonas sp. LC2018020214]
MQKIIFTSAVSIIAALLLSACNNSEKTEVNNSQALPKTAEIIIKEPSNNQKSDTIFPKKESSQGVIKNASKSINSSGDKLIFNSEQLFKGDVIYNQNLKQKGVVTGTLTITLNTDSVPDELKNNYELIKSTAHNYTLLVEKDVDIAGLSSALNSYKSVTNVEIAINYSPIETHF